MSLNYDVLKTCVIESALRYSKRDTILYALGIGLDDPSADLRYLYEKGLVAFPTIAAVLATPRGWLADPKFGVDYSKLVHASQHLSIHATIPPEGEVAATLTVEEVFDRGPAKGAMVASRTELFNAITGTLLATARQTFILKADGGFGGRAPPIVPEDQWGASLAVVDIATRRGQAALYRLAGDYNPLHIDPAASRSAGFDGPILHGLCTYAIAARAAVDGKIVRDASAIRSFGASFTKCVFPGETLRFEFREGAKRRIGITCVALERNMTVLKGALDRVPKTSERSSTVHGLT